VLDEQVRGSVPDPSLFSLSRLEQIRAFARGLMPGTPSTRLLGYRVTRVSSGTAVLTQPISPWFEVCEGFIDLVSNIVHDLAVGSGLVFSDRGVHTLRGLEGEWHLWGLGV
jgi:hypothetical protein